MTWINYKLLRRPKFLTSKPTSFSSLISCQISLAIYYLTTLFFWFFACTVNSFTTAGALRSYFLLLKCFPHPHLCQSFTVEFCIYFYNLSFSTRWCTPWNWDNIFLCSLYPSTSTTQAPDKNCCMIE